MEGARAEVAKDSGKDKQMEREVYPSGNGVGGIRNKSQELLSAFTPSSKSSKSQAIKTLQAENQSLTTQIQTLQGQLQSASEREQAARSRIHALEEQARTMERKSAQDEEEIQSLLQNSTRSTEAAARHIRELEQRSQGLEEQVKKLRERVQKAEAAAAQAQSQVASTSKAPSRRGTASSQEVQAMTAERRAEEVFRSKADTYAGAEIVRMVQSLNGEILQCAAFMAETVMATNVRVPEDARTVEKCRKRTIERVGQRLTAAMRRTIDTGERDPFPLQLALQHSLIVWACYIVQAFTPENRDLNAQLAGIWSRISTKGMISSDPLTVTSADDTCRGGCGLGQVALHPLCAP